MITLTHAAAAHIQTILAGKDDVLGIRVGVKNAGCSGFSYTLDFAHDVKAEDQVFGPFGDGIKVIIDQQSLEFLRDTEIDCVQQGLNKILKFNNPNVKGECGCGESFSA